MILKGHKIRVICNQIYISIISVRNLLLHYVARYCIISTWNNGKNLKKMSCMRHIEHVNNLFSTCNYYVGSLMASPLFCVSEYNNDNITTYWLNYPTSSRSCSRDFPRSAPRGFGAQDLILTQTSRLSGLWAHHGRIYLSYVGPLCNFSTIHSSMLSSHVSLILPISVPSWKSFYASGETRLYTT